ncbi:hypothetical protein KR215_012195 [Drosophila sulfurigaster]|uniref:uncharacterized protein LOC133843678 n=1 Tax=Drosophila sulfurigaster albostrigata TaxID=89887 RepID=UPI002D21D45A|nr:uncharacterized protein LOC133843678 [Drosophila sulfurigaster albostrigata]KAH8398404.1 hypothetical protein KR215_012195 [Drosophila sulfurigaster]
MNEETLDIQRLMSFQTLVDTDKQLCLDNYSQERMDEKHRMNKYFKRSEYIAKQYRCDPADNECFLAFDVYPVNNKYCAVIFSLCGISSHFFYVLYWSVIEESRLEDPEKFICDLLAHIFISEIPKLKKFLVKFVLCRNSVINERVIKLFAESRKTAKLYNTFPFICEPLDLRHHQLHDPYTQHAWMEILQGNIEQTTVREIFSKYREIAIEKGNTILQQFVEQFFYLARDLLDSRFQINLRLCTMERMDNFERIIRAHMKDYTDKVLSRMFVFDLIRALIHIYGF